MPAPYQGNAANITQFATATISNATNATPIAITTSAAHLYANGDTVVITGATGNTAANGTFVIAVTGSTSFTLTGSVGNGAYAGGGTAKDTNLLPFAAQPSNGDVFTVDQLNTYLSNLADKIQFAALSLSTKINLAQVTNRLVTINQQILTTNATVPTTFGDVPGMSITLSNVAIGDVLVFDAWMIANATITQTLLTDLTAIDNGTTVRLNLNNQQQVTSTDLLARTASGVYLVTGGGSVTVKVQGSASSATLLGSTTGTSGPCSRIRVMQYRP